MAKITAVPVFSVDRYKTTGIIIVYVPNASRLIHKVFRKRKIRFAGEVLPIAGRKQQREIITIRRQDAPGAEPEKFVLRSCVDGVPYE